MRNRPGGRGQAVQVPGAAPLPGRAPASAAPQAAGRWRADPLRMALFALVFLTVSRANAHFPFLAAIRPLLLLSGAAVAFAMMNPRYVSRLPWMKTWPARFSVALGATACLSAVFGISLGGSARYILEEYSKTLMLAFLLMATLASARDVHWYIWAYVAATGVLVYDALFFFKIERPFGDQEFYRLSNMYTYDANDIGVVLLVGLALTLYTFQLSKTVGKVVSITIIVGIGAALAKSGSRGAFLGLIVFGVATLVLIDSVALWKRVTFIVVTAGALILTSPPGYWEQMKTMLAPTADYNWTATSGRKQVTTRGMGYIARYPVFGVGIGNFPMAEGTLSDLALNWHPALPGVRWSAPHNSFLQAGAEMGLVGLTLWAGLLGGIVLGSTRLGRRLPRAWRNGSFDQRVAYQAPRYIALAALSFAVTGAFVSFAYMDTLYYLASLTVGVILLTRWMRTLPLQAPPQAGRGGVAAAPYSSR